MLWQYVVSLAAESLLNALTAPESCRMMEMILSP